MPPSDDVCLFRRGLEDMDRHFRIPSLLTTRGGALLAVCEARRPDIGGDQAANSVVLRRSTDDGDTWSPVRVVVSDGDNALNNPTLVQSAQAGRIFMMYQRYPAGMSTHDVEPGYEGDRICRTFVIHSDDDGDTWSSPREITRDVKPPGATASVVGPGVGIQLRRGPHAGRLVMPFYQSPAPDQVYAVYSDDHGQTWQRGSPAENVDPGYGNEDQIVELTDGSLLLNCRQTGQCAPCRKTATSADGGETWSGLIDEPALPAPPCHGSILRYSDPLDAEPSRILFCSPSSPTAREHGVVRLSENEGRTWSAGRTLKDDSFAYCCLARLSGGRIGCLYEAAVNDDMQIFFARFSLDWLIGGE